MRQTHQLSELLTAGRKAAGLTQKEAALRVGVSHRLWAEVEQGRRPNVSMTTMLKMLGEVGVTVRATAASGSVVEIRSRESAAMRAAMRRATWTGRQLLLRDEGSVDLTPAKRGDRLAAAAEVSRQAYAFAKAGKPPTR